MKKYPNLPCAHCITSQQTCKEMAEFINVIIHFLCVSCIRSSSSYPEKKMSNVTNIVTIRYYSNEFLVVVIETYTIYNFYYI